MLLHSLHSNTGPNPDRLVGRISTPSLRDPRAVEERIRALGCICALRESIPLEERMRKNRAAARRFRERRAIFMAEEGAEEGCNGDGVEVRHSGRR